MNHSDFTKQFVKVKMSISQNMCPNREKYQTLQKRRENSQQSSLSWETLKLRA